ncbi:MAG: YceI family protein [Flavobacteriaceae bacterium]|nr:YceI family protein [Flavobacteriaceae bacterium]
MRLSIFYKIIILTVIFLLFIYASKPNKNTQQIEYNTYIIDTANSKLHWNCAHFGFMKFKRGEIILEKDIQPVKANFTIDMKSVKNTDIDSKLLQGTLQNVLKSIEFFNTDKYPESYFESHFFEKISKNNYKISGDFIIFDIGICYDFEGTVELKNDSLYFNTKAIVLDRTDWAIFYGSAKNPWPKEEEDGFVVTDTIILDAHIRAYKKKE